MNILLANMPIQFNTQENLEPPLGVAYIAAFLRKENHNVKIKDFEVEDFSRRILSDILNGFSPQVVGISCRTSSYKSTKQLTRLIKEINSNIFVVIGGHHVSAFVDDSLKDTGCDAVIRGEGEIAMVELAYALTKGKNLSSIRGLSYRTSNRIHHNPNREPIQDLDSLPFPAWDLLPMNKYVVNCIITSRGCPFSCIYCDKSISTQNVRYRSAQNVYEEISALIKIGQNKLIFFVDDFFFLNRKRVLELFDLLKNNNCTIQWRCQSRVSPLDLSLLPKAKECGCEMIIFGIETGDEKELEFINKKSTLEDAEKAVKATKKAGISVRANFMLGFPISTKETIKNSIKFAVKLPIDICRFFLVVPFPNTSLWDYVIKHNLIESKNIDWEKFDLYNTSYKVPGMSQDELRCYAGAAYLHILKGLIVKDIFLYGFRNLTRFIKLVAKYKRIRGNISRSFPALSNLLVDLRFLSKKTSFFNKLMFILKIIRTELDLRRP